MFIQLNGFLIHNLILMKKKSFENSIIVKTEQLCIYNIYKTINIELNIEKQI